VEWDIDTENGKLSDAESSLLSSYNKEMKRLRRALKDNDSYNEDTYYLFMLPASDNRDLNGYMPLTGQFGFIFTKPKGYLIGQEELNRNIAHELSHGAFHLWHTFSDKNKYMASQGTTHNLMDYTNNPDDRELIKYQWDYVHDPESMIGWLQEDGEGEAVSIPELLLIIRQANINDEKIIEITQDQCPENAYMDVPIGNATLKYFAIHCTDDFETIPTEPGSISFLDWELNDDNKRVQIIPSSKNTTIYETTLGWAKMYKFYETEELSPPLDYSESDNLLFEFVILKKDADKFEDYLYPPKQIVIKYTRKERNEYRTWGEFEIVGKSYSGYILEREKGSSSTAFESGKRIPAGTYELMYSEDAFGERQEFYYTTPCIKEHTGYKLHGGNRADQSTGCLLINANSPQNDPYPTSFQYNIPGVSSSGWNPNRANVANEYYEHSDLNNPAYKLRNKVLELENEIKKLYNLETVKKILIINESTEIIKP
jgi:hypothetical protein